MNPATAPVWQTTIGYTWLLALPILTLLLAGIKAGADKGEKR